jgi:Zn-dependent peptidase ImmA (M78 family)
MKAIIHAKNLKIARERMNLSVVDAAKKMNITNPQQLIAAENGESHITFVQLNKAAKIYDIPLGYFYLDEMPVDDTPITDYRMNPNYYGSPKSTELIKTINTAIKHREEILDIAANLGNKIPLFDAQCTIEEDIEIVGNKIRQLFPDKCFASKSDILNRLISQLENIGIFVTRIGGEAHNKVSYEEFDGAAIYFDTLPIILLNVIDAQVNKNRIVFTIFHELAHLVLKNSALTNFYFDDNSLLSSQMKKVETFCNNAAAAALLPKERLQRDFDDNSIYELADKYRVSKYVVTIRLKNINLISQLECDKLLAKYNKEYLSRPTVSYSTDAQINPNIIKKRNMGNLYISYIRDALSNNYINYLDALNSLGMKDKAARKVLYGK